MLNMIKLDWLAMKFYRKRIVYLLPLVIVYTGILSETILVQIVAFMMASFSVNPFAVEEKGQLDNFYLTLPVKRETIVSARFGLSLAIQLAGLLISVPSTLLLSSLLRGRTVLIFTHNFRPDLTSMMLIVCMSLLCYSVMILAMFPPLFKFGYAKGKTLGFFMPIGALGLVVFIAYILYFFSEPAKIWMGSTMGWCAANLIPASAIMLCAAALMFLLAYGLSQRIYAKREF